MHGIPQDEIAIFRRDIWVDAFCDELGNMVVVDDVHAIYEEFQDLEPEEAVAIYLGGN